MVLEAEDDSDEWVELESEIEIESEPDSDSEDHSTSFIEDRKGEEEYASFCNEERLCQDSAGCIAMRMSSTGKSEEGVHKVLKKTKRVRFSHDVEETPMEMLEEVKKQRRQRAADIAQSRVSVELLSVWEYDYIREHSSSDVLSHR